MYRVRGTVLESESRRGEHEGEGNEEGEGVKGQVTTGTDESRADISIRGFWKWGTSAILDMLLVNLYTGSYLHQASAKALETAEKEKKDK